MRLACFTVCALLFLPVCALAGNIFGVLREFNKPLYPAEILLMCGGPKPYLAKTEPDGSYRLFARETARCIFQVNYQGLSGKTEVFSYSEPTRYDFDVTREAGRLTLRRR